MRRRSRFYGVVGLTLLCGSKCSLGRVTVVKKGTEDVISDGTDSPVARCSEAACMRRCGGQGDVLAGCIATYLSWTDRRDVVEKLRAAGWYAAALFPHVM